MLLVHISCTYNNNLLTICHLCVRVKWIIKRYCMKNYNLGEDNLIKIFSVNVIPAVIAMVINGAQPIIDGLFLGKFAGLNAMASVNIAGPFMQIIFAISFIICTGAISVIGRSLGSGNKDKAQSVFRTSCVFMTALSILVTIFGSIFAKNIAIGLKATDLLVQDSSMYIFIISFFAPVMCNMYLTGFTDRVIGKPNQYLYGAIISLCANVLLDYLLIGVANLGVLGGALATGISYFIALVVCSIPLFKKKNDINFYSGKIKFKLMLPVISNGSSEAVVCSSTAISVFLFNSVLLSLAGESGVVAFTIINYISTFGTLAMFCISDGINAIISYNYGANNMKRVKNTFLSALILNFIIGLIVFLIVYFAGDKLITIFSKDPVNDKQVIEMAFHGAKIYSIAFFMIGFNIVSSGFFTAIGGALSSILIAASRGLVWIFVGILVLPKFFGIDGVWWTFPFAEILTIVLTSILFIVFIFKQKKKITHQKSGDKQVIS